MSAGKPDSVILCGFMGCGKSTLGPLIAERLGKPFIDLNDFMRAKFDDQLPEIYMLLGGEEGFRDEEHAALRTLLAQRQHVIAGGEGSMLAERDRELLGPRDRVLLLDPGFETCYARIADSAMPLVRANSAAALHALYEQHMECYGRAADQVLRADGPPAELAAQAVGLLGK